MTDFTFDDQLPLRIEVTPAETPDPSTDDTTQEVLRISQQASTAIRQASNDATKQAFNTIYVMARRTGQMIAALQQQDDQASLERVEISFGIKFNGDVEAFVAKAGAEATVNVTINWKPGVEVQHD